MRRGPMHNDRGLHGPPALSVGSGLKPAPTKGQIMTMPNEALRTILPIAGWGDTQAADVTFTGGGDPVLPTPFRVGAAGAATLAASALARSCGRLGPGGVSA